MVTIIGKGDDGKSYSINITEIADTPPVGTPPVWQLPATFNAIQFSPTVFIHVDGVNVPRGANQVIIYTDMIAYRPVNDWGVDILVMGDTGRGLLMDREKKRNAPFSAINPGTFVISAHGTAAQAIRDIWSSTPQAVQLVTRDIVVPPPVDTPPTGDPAGKGWITVWGMVFGNSPKVDFGKLPLEVDELSLAFIIENGKISGYSQYGLNALKAQFQEYMNARPGRIISGSLGGGGQTLDTSNVTQFIANLKNIEQQLGIKWGGLNCDLENDTFPKQVKNIIAIYRAFLAERPNFVCSWSPNGSWVDAYVSALRGNVDVIGWIAQQFYDSKVSVNDAANRIQQMLDAQIPISRIGIGMMIEDNNSQRWTLNQCVTNATILVDKFPGLRHVNNWEASRQQLPQWSTAMRGIIK